MYLGEHKKFAIYIVTSEQVFMNAITKFKGPSIFFDMFIAVQNKLELEIELNLQRRIVVEVDKIL